MSYTTDLIDLFKDKHNLESDYAAARLLEIRPNRISNYRTGVSHADDKTAVMLAEALGLDRLETIARVNMDRARDRNDKAFWKRLAATTTLLLLVVAPSLNPAAAITADPGSDGATNMHYAKWQRVLTIIRRVLGLRRGHASTALLA